MSATPTRPPLPADPIHQRLADYILMGDTHAEAYGKCFPKAKTTSRNPACARILKRADVVAYMDYQRAQSATSTTLTLQEKREFLARVVRCKITTEKDESDLWQEWREVESETGVTVFKKLPSKTEAIKLDNELCGDDPAKNALDALASAFANLRHA